MIAAEVLYQEISGKVSCGRKLKSQVDSMNLYDAISDNENQGPKECVWYYVQERYRD